MDSVSGRPGGIDIAFFLQNLAGGGAERAIVALAGEIANRGHAVELVVADAAGDYDAEISAAVRLQDLATQSPLKTLLGLTAYLRRRNPAVVMSALDTPNIMLVMAAKLSRYKGRIIVSQRAVVDASHCELTPARRVLTKLLQRICFPHVDALISNSHAATDDVRAQFRMGRDQVVTIHNALDVGRIDRLAGEALDHQLLPQQRAPLIVSVGSFTRRKDMGTLIEAFAKVRARRAAELVIVGKGPEQRNIESLIAKRGLTASVHLPGFDANPYKWMAAAAVFVSSSTAEGFPNVVAEALALGRPIVATDCPGDTAKLLEHGKWGRLVPVGDAERMAQAILDALDDPNPPDGRIRAADFAPASITSAYLNILLPKYQ